ncbi:hypothetical protein DPEC_G00302980 [Dallia pectoralis]|uniref:Uncharacterized protein n=1 Tax=Dallia pectoralis TaxID=75939 RepID=A0ACC2FH80_DALPE|nr:hypothetical protein DPEC_G00302980 [Dallia pectoralis]
MPIPSEGYTIRYLREESGLKKCVTYLVPIQKSLNTDVGNFPVLQNEVVVKEKCLQCGEEVPLHALGDHLTTCVGRTRKEDLLSLLQGDTPEDSQGIYDGL